MAELFGKIGERARGYANKLSDGFIGGVLKAGEKVGIIDTKIRQKKDFFDEISETLIDIGEFCNFFTNDDFINSYTGQKALSQIGRDIYTTSDQLFVMMYNKVDKLLKHLEKISPEWFVKGTKHGVNLLANAYKFAEESFSKAVDYAKNLTLEDVKKGFSKFAKSFTKLMKTIKEKSVETGIDLAEKAAESKPGKAFQYLLEKSKKTVEKLLGKNIQSVDM